MATDPNEGTEAAPRSVGRYELGPALGPSAYGSLCKAKVLSGADAGRQVALRVIERRGLDAEGIELLSSVGFSAMEVRDPHLAAVLDVVLEDRSISIVSEWVDGVRLRDLLARAGEKGCECPIPVAVRVAKDVIAALSAAKRHWAEIYSDVEGERRMLMAIHGGLVPDTVLVASFGESMLCEIGMSGAAMSIPSQRESVEALSHRAPEQLVGAADERTDVFTIGVFIWELLAGRALFGPTAVPRAGGSIPPPPLAEGAAQLASVKRKLESGSIQRLDMIPKLKGKLSKALADVVSRATDREAKRRFTSLEELLRALESACPDVAEHETVAAYVSTVLNAGPPRSVPPRASVGPPTSSRATRPPIDTLSDVTLQERATKPPSLPGVTASEVSAALAAPPPLRPNIPPPLRPNIPPPPRPHPNVPPPPDSIAALADEPFPSSDAEAISVEPDGDASGPGPGRAVRSAGTTTDASSVAMAAARTSTAEGGSRTLVMVLAAVAVVVIGAVVFLSGEKEETPTEKAGVTAAPRPASKRVPTAAPADLPQRGGTPDAGTRAAPEEASAAPAVAAPPPAVAPSPVAPSEDRPASAHEEVRREDVRPLDRTPPKPKAKLYRPDDI